MKPVGIIAALLLLFLPLSARAQSVVVTAERMLDVLTGRYVQEPVIVITDGRIVSVVGRDGGRPNIPAGARRIDLPGMTLLPGLIDMHVHLASTPLINGYDRLEYTDAFWPTLAVPNARAMLEAGFTTIRSVGADDYSDVAIRQGIEDGYYPGPRIVAAGPSFGPTGGHCDINDLPPSIVFRDGEHGVNGPAEVRGRVRELRRRGAQVIKICATGGVFSSNTSPGAQQMGEDEIRAAVEEAHMLGLRVAAHAHGTEGIKAAIRAGVDTIEHASFLDDEAIRMARERGTWLSMDIYNTEYTLSEGERNGVRQENLDKERQVGTRQRESFRQSVRGGARHVFGTDAGVYPHGTGGRQFRVMTEFGMTPLQAIQAATSNAAEALGRTNDVGAIAAGRYGDMIAVPGDPLANVRLLETVPIVIKGGNLVADRRSDAAAAAR
ncbi:MAG: amidohydrolase family protein [Alphaproteobacteria bacterium]|nr:amidohydrolase family protein [Alphaproteobacteria bacterium]